MSTLNTTSPLDPDDAVYDYTIPAGEPWLHEMKQGQTLRILDLMGNQAVDTLFYNAADPGERYSAQDTIQAQGSIYLTAGSKLLSTAGNVMLTITADTCGRHDTLGMEPAQPSRTKCATRSKSGRCTTAGTTICWRSPSPTTRWANET